MVRRVLSEWTDPERVAEYLSREIPHRDVAESLLLEALPRRVGRVLDLGTGDGRLLALVCSRHTGAQAVGIDSSQPMLARAAERFGSCTTVELVVHDLNQPLAVSVPFDVVVSALQGKAVVLSGLDRQDEALQVLTELIERFQDDENPDIQNIVAEAREEIVNGELMRGAG